MELDFQGTTHKFLKTLSFPGSFYNTSRSPLSKDSFFACSGSSIPCEVLGLYLSGEVMELAELPEGSQAGS